MYLFEELAENKKKLFAAENSLRDWNVDVINHYEQAGYVTIPFSLIFNRIADKAGWSRLTQAQTDLALKFVLIEFDRKCGMRNGKRVDRLVYSHSGALNDNPHYHGLFFIPEDLDTTKIIEKYSFSTNKVRSKPNGKGGCNFIDVSASRAEFARNIRSVASYLVHEGPTLNAQFSHLTIESLAA